MASTAEGTALTEAHRQAQIRLRAATVRDVLAVLSTFDPERISESWSSIEPVLVLLIQSRQPMSVALAERYVAEFRAAEGVTGAAPVVAVPELAAAEIIPNLRYVGPREARRLESLARPLATIADVTAVNVEGEVSRQVLNGGRTAITASVSADRRALGWYRVTDGSPCAFCAMLAGRGPVYKAETASFEAHRKCGCSAEPIYRNDQAWPDSAERYRAQYAQATRNVTEAGTKEVSADVRREFRRLHGATEPTT